MCSFQILHKKFHVTIVMLLLWIIYISYCKSKFFLLQTNPNKVIKRINFKKHAQVWFD
jgi:hypothetical protein